MRFGLRLPIVQGPFVAAWEAEAPFASVVHYAREAERLGFSFVAAAEHIVVPRSEAAWMGARWADPFVVLSNVAAHTQRVELLTAVAVVPYRNPLVLAKTAATLDWVCDGRLILGVSAGYLEAEFAALGVPFESRGRVTDEGIAAVVRALDADVFTLAGSEQELMIAPRADRRQRPPIWVGGSSKASIRRAARFADGWVPNRIGPARVAELLEFARSVDGFDAKADRFRVCASINPMGARAERGQSASVPGRLSDLSAERTLAEVRDWIEAGATELRVHVFTESAAEFDETIQWFADEIIVKVSDTFP